MIISYVILYEADLDSDQTKTIKKHTLQKEKADPIPNFTVLVTNSFVINFESANFKYDNSFFKLQPKKYINQAKFGHKFKHFYSKLCTFINSRGADFKYNNNKDNFDPRFKDLCFCAKHCVLKIRGSGCKHDNSVFKFNVKNDEHPNKTILVSGLSGFLRTKLCSFAISRMLISIVYSSKFQPKIIPKRHCHCKI